MSKSSFCHICVKEPFYYLLPSPTEARHKIPRRNKPFFAGSSIYLVYAAIDIRGGEDGLETVVPSMLWFALAD